MSTTTRPIPGEGTLRDRFAALRQRRRFVVLTRGIAFTLTVLLLNAAIAGYLDWCYHLPDLVRATLLIVLLVHTLLVAYFSLMRPLAQRSDDLSLALRIEEQYPHLNDSLASAVEFLNQPAPSGESPPVRREAIRRALGKAGNCDFNRIVDRRGLAFACGEAVVLLALLATVLVIAPATAATAFARLAVPFGAFDWPRLTKLEVEPPRLRIGRNEAFELRGKVQGVIPETATILFRYDHFPERRETVRLVPIDDEARFVRRWRSEEVTSSFRVQVLAGDAESQEFAVEVVPPPELALLNGEPSPQVTLDIPRYTDLPTPMRLTPGNGNVDAVTGTVVTFRAAADRPLARAWIDYVPDLPFAQLSAAFAPLGATDWAGPFGAATLLSGGESVWGHVPASFDDDRSRFTIRFAPRVSGLFVLTLEDDMGLRSSPRTFDLRLRQDPQPIVHLDFPAAGRDVFSVLRIARLTMNIHAEDPTFALRSVFLRYHTQVNEDPRHWVYYDHASAAQKLFAPFAGTGILAAPPRLRPTRLELEMPLRITQFKHANGTPLKPGDVLILQACADDFDDVTVNKAPGASPEVRLLIVDLSGLERDLNRELTIIQNVLREQRDKEQAALLDTASLENRLNEGENLNTTDLEALSKAEQVQRELRDRFGEKKDQLRDQLRRVQETLRQNGMANAPMRERMRQVEKELQRLSDNDLALAEQRLARARQQLEPSALAEERARAAERRAEELELQAKNLSKEADKLESDARKTADLRVKEKMLTEAKRNRNQAAEAELQVPALRREADGAQREAAKLLRESKAREDLDAARKREEEVEKTLNDILSRLEPSSAIGEIKGEARDLLDAQRQLEARTEEMERNTRGKQPEELTLQEREELKAIRDAEQELEERTSRLMDRMRKEADGRADTEPELAEKLRNAAKEAENSVLGNMRDAREKIGKNQLGDARSRQKASAAALESLARKLGLQSEAEQEQLVKKLRAAEKELEKIRAEQDELSKKIKDLKAGKGGLNEKERADELKRLAKRQEELQDQAQNLAKRLTRDGRARQALDKAVNNPDEMLERLEEAQRELKHSREREQEVLEREQLTRILEVIERLRDRQIAMNAESGRVQTEVKEGGGWTRGLRQSLLDLRDAQNGVKAEVEAIIPTDLATTPVFARVLQRAAEAMGRAAQRAADLVEEEKRGNAGPDRLPDAELLKQQSEALRRLDQVIDAVKAQLEAPPTPRPKSQNNNGGEEPEGGSPPQTGLPPLAQLKLLRTLQQDVNKRSEEFVKAHPDLNKLSEREKTEYNSLIRDQQDVRELLEEMRHPSGEPAGDKKAGPKQG